MENLSAREARTGFRVEKLHTLLVADHTDTLPNVEWRELDAYAEGSHIRGSWSFPGRTLEEVFDKWVEVPSEIQLNASTWDMNTLTYFMTDTVPVKGRSMWMGSYPAPWKGWKVSS